MIPRFNLTRIASTLRIAQKKKALHRKPVLRTIQPVSEEPCNWSMVIEHVQGYTVLEDVLWELWRASPLGPSFRFCAESSSGNDIDYRFTRSQMQEMWDRIMWAQGKGYIVSDTDFEEEWMIAEQEPPELRAWVVMWENFMPRDFVDRQNERFNKVIEDASFPQSTGDEFLLVRLLVAELNDETLGRW